MAPDYYVRSGVITIVILMNYGFVIKMSIKLNNVLKTQQFISMKDQQSITCRLQHPPT